MTKISAIGIDLGTSYSRAAVFVDGKVEILVNDHGSRKTPSCVAFTNTGLLVGDVAKDQITRNLENTVFDCKRFIGRRFDDPAVQSDLKRWPFKVIGDDRGKPKVQVQYRGEVKTFTPEELSAMVLMKMKETAEAFLGSTIKDAVITVPAQFNNSQRQATVDAGTIAGLNVLRVLNEPTAAALAYGFGKNRNTGERNVLILDLGGGALDVSIVNVEDGIFEVKATLGDTHLGGEDFDNNMVRHFAADFKWRHCKDLSTSHRPLARLRNACERAKRALSASSRTSIEIDSLFEGIDFYAGITRDDFEEMNTDLFNSIVESVQKLLYDAKMDKSQIRDIVLVGGSSRIPKIQELLSNFFSGCELDRSLNPDEAVACGAAIQAAILAGDKSETLKETLVVDIVPHSLGIATGDEEMFLLIKRNSSIPTQKSHIFETHLDDQPSILTQIYEGEHTAAKENNLLGKFAPSGILSRPAGVTQIEVRFNIDCNGILDVSTEDKSTRKRVAIPVDKGQLTKEEVERMAREAEKYEPSEDAHSERVAARNTLEFYALGVRHTIAAAKKKCDEIIEWLDRNYAAEKEQLEVQRNELESACISLITQLYESKGKVS